MKESKIAVIIITAEKTKYEFNNEKVEITTADNNYTMLSNQLFRFIQKQLAEVRKRG